MYLLMLILLCFAGIAAFAWFMFCLISYLDSPKGSQIRKNKLNLLILAVIVNITLVAITIAFGIEFLSGLTFM